MMALPSVTLFISPYLHPFGWTTLRSREGYTGEEIIDILPRKLPSRKERAVQGRAQSRIERQVRQGIKQLRTHEARNGREPSPPCM